uniref:Uncharacterized protein n=1 Tax=Molossus molossus TaxID=27622 RepID=A0A7J8J0P3_MOLMO|nr:hypothetical protein HJG59_010302 [Molossus molossus]
MSQVEETFENISSRPTTTLHTAQRIISSVVQRKAANQRRAQTGSRAPALGQSRSRGGLTCPELHALVGGEERRSTGSTPGGRAATQPYQGSAPSLSEVPPPGTFQTRRRFRDTARRAEAAKGEKNQLSVTGRRRWIASAEEALDDSGTTGACRRPPLPALPCCA